MNFDLREPCNNCPFRTDIRPFLRQDRAEEIAESIVECQQPFPCHKSIEHDDDGEYIPGTAKEQHCAGAAIMLLHMRRPNQLMRIAMRLRLFDPERLNLNAPVFDNAEDWIAAQEER